MIRTISLPLAALLAAGCATSPSSSDEALAAFRDVTPSLPEAFSDTSSLDAFRADPNESYQVGPGDLLFVEVWGHEDLSGLQRIGPDGMITVPTVGAMSVSGLTRNGAANAVKSVLAPYYKNLSVTVRVDEYFSNSVSVLGGVLVPGAYPFEYRPTLLAAISKAGGLADLDPDRYPSRASVMRGDNQIVWVDLRELLERGNLSLNLTLRANDVVYVQDASDRLVYVVGEVRGPGVFHLTPGMTLIDAIGLAGGFGIDAQPEDLRVVRPSDGTELDVDFEELVAGRMDLNVPLREGDIIYVPMSGLGKFGYTLRQISPFSSTFTGGI